MENMERELCWDDQIQVDGAEFVLLPEGDYDFIVESFERGRHTPSGEGKLPACNKATLTLKVEHNGKTARIMHNLFLHTQTEGMLSAFFTAIGQKKKGEPVTMNWNLVPGSTGKAKIRTKTYKENQYNEVARFYPKENAPGAGKGFETGRF